MLKGMVWDDSSMAGVGGGGCGLGGWRRDGRVVEER